MQHCEKDFLYHIETPGLLYLTIDDHKAVYVGFRHKLQLEVCLAKDTETCITKKAFAGQGLQEDGVKEEPGEDSMQDYDIEVINSPREEERATSKVRENVSGPTKPRRGRPPGRKNRKLVNKHEEEVLCSRKEKLMVMKPCRVDNVGYKTSSWKLARLRGNRAKRKSLLASEAGRASLKQDDAFTCKFCRKTFGTKQELFDHHKVLKPPTFHCELCDAGFPFLAHLKVHMKYHKKDKANIFICDECGLNAKSSTGLKKHMMKHTEERCYRCCVCGKESSCLGTSKMHLLTHSREKECAEKDLDAGVQGLGVVAVRQEGKDPVYTCTYCKQIFQTKKEFFDHARIINPPNFECKICSQKFPLRSVLAVHMKEHNEYKSGRPQYACDECGLDTKTLTRLKRHMLIHTGENCYRCCVCGKESPYYGTAKLHLKMHDKSANTSNTIADETGDADTEKSGDKGFDPLKVDNAECVLCSTVFSSKKELINHHKIGNPLTHKCEECPAAFPFRAYLLVHMKNHGDDKANGKLYTCDECGLDAKNTTRLRRHMITHTKEHCYKCCICPKTMSCFSTAQKHYTYHQRAGLIKCTCCGESFPGRQALAAHQLEVMQIKCEICGQEFPNRTSRTLHIKSDHPHQLIRCQFCNRVFTTQEGFKTHMIYHDKVKKKQCPVCGKFVSRLDKHMLSHRSMSEMDESELWMCYKCPMKFKLKSSFIRHLASHSEERNFHCHLCPKTFTSGSELGRHLRRHSSLTPHQCTECGKWFRERRNLKSHMQVHSDIKPYKCTICPQSFNYKSSLDGHIRSKHEPRKRVDHSSSTGTGHLLPSQHMSMQPLVQTSAQVPLQQPPIMPPTQTPVNSVVPPNTLPPDHLAPLVQFTVWPYYNQQ